MPPPRRVAATRSRKFVPAKAFGRSFSTTASPGAGAASAKMAPPGPARSNGPPGHPRCATCDLRVERLAERAGMSPRHFARAHRERTGRTPAKTVGALRVEAARRLSQRPGPGIAAVAHACGFGDEEQRMRRAFVRCLGVPPAAYRTRFGRES